MNKNIKELTKLLYMKFLNEDLLSDLEDEDDDDSEFVYNSHKLKLTECSTPELVISFFKSQYDLELISKFFVEFAETMWNAPYMAHSDADKLAEKYNNSIKDNNMKFSPDGGLKITANEICPALGYYYTYAVSFQPNETDIDPEFQLIYRNKPVILKCYTINDHIAFLREVPGKDKLNVLIKQKNEELIKNIPTLVNEVFTHYISQFTIPKRTAEEVSCTGKVYKVTQKDIDRMKKCVETQNYTGFKKITQPAKMVARLAALCIVEGKCIPFDDTMLSFYLYHKPNMDRAQKTTYNRYGPRSTYARRYYRLSNNEDLAAVLGKLREFDNLHLKDVIETYNAYKDQF